MKLRSRAARRAFRELVAGVQRTRSTVDGRPGDCAVAQKAVLFLSGCPGDAKRYRADHQAEQLAFLGATADAFLTDEIPFDEILDRYRYLVLHRVGWDPSLEQLLSEAARRGVPVLFDTDDLMFDPGASRYVAALAHRSDEGRQAFVEGVGRYRKTLASVDGAIVSTDTLADEARRVRENVEVTYNAASAEMVRLSDAVRSARSTPTAKPPTVAYLSGTPSHDRDFAEAADSILWMLEQYAESRFVAVGHLELDPRFDSYGSRVSRIPFRPWQELPEIIAAVDVNLAPLEPDNPFTDSKSCVKYIEAGLVGVPTIASPRRDFVRAIRHGENGLLAESPAEWRSALRQLVESPTIRHEIGRQAYEDVRARHTTLARARSFHSTLRDFVPSHAGDPLTVNWVVGAPAPGSADHRTIFRLAAHLAERGHHTRMYVEPTAGLQGRSLPFEVHVGHDAIAPADISFATSPRTAKAVAAHSASLFKGYLIQDLDAANASYELHLRHICYGPELALEPARIEKLLLDWAFVRLDPSVVQGAATSPSR
jgi:glycosyltransferase involved in cell wall biosynthesis